MTAPAAFGAPNMAKTSALVNTPTGINTLNGAKTSARELRDVRPNVGAALRIASYGVGLLLGTHTREAWTNGERTV